MWDRPRPGFEPESPALAGGFLTTEPPGKSKSALFLSFMTFPGFAMLAVLPIWKGVWKSKVYSLKAVLIGFSLIGQPGMSIICSVDIVLSPRD